MSRHAAPQLIAAFLLAMATPATAFPADPLGSPMWDAYARTLFGNDPVRFDDRVSLDMPLLAENQRVFPVTIDARGLTDVKRIVLFADLNPIGIAVDYALDGAAPYLATRIKLDQRTPVRAAVQRADGSWLVAAHWIDAAGGGCSAPPVSRVKGDWAEHLGEIRGRRWREAEGGQRLRIGLRHPMDTGLVENIPAYHLETLDVSDTQGRSLARLRMWAAVAEDPALTLILDGTAPLAVEARDTNGRIYKARFE